MLSATLTSQSFLNNRRMRDREAVEEANGGWLTPRGALIGFSGRLDTDADARGGVIAESCTVVGAFG